MSTGLHKDLDFSEIHTVVAWVYANETERLTATGFTASDLYKLAFQESTGNLWLLDRTSPVQWMEIASEGSISVYGTAHQENSDDGESSTTSGSFQQKLRMTTGDLLSGTYRIGWYYEWHKSNKTNFVTQVQVNDTTTAMSVFEEAVDSGANQWFARSGFYYHTGSGILNVDLDYHADGSGTASIRRARLEIWRVS